MSSPQSIRPEHDAPGNRPRIDIQTEIGPGPGPRRPLWQIGRRAGVIVACMGFGALAACGLSLGTQTVQEAGDIDVGECLQIGEEAGEGRVEATKEKCEGVDGLTFYAAAKVDASAECTADHTSSLTFANGDQKLCLTPNLTAGTCYQIPVNGGRLADYKEVECGTTAAENTVVAETVGRGDASITCAADQTRWTFTEPEAIGYCLAEDVAAAGRFGG
ncbi:pyridine nucleotide-disulfide oxidoreductase [Gordonia aurantiaca]|uniref:pyridine nucleotide-disulfide oxidoreductase n=1 Tax=Gordonia sp. B21 TaxID=3151852 RepID=UPI0032677EE2